MFWTFAIINGRLAEVFFDREKRETRFLGHCYVKESEYTTKKEKEWIKKDTARLKLVYRSRKYKVLL